MKIKSYRVQIKIGYDKTINKQKLLKGLNFSLGRSYSRLVLSLGPKRLRAKKIGSRNRNNYSLLIKVQAFHGSSTSEYNQLTKIESVLLKAYKSAILLLTRIFTAEIR